MGAPGITPEDEISPVGAIVSGGLSLLGSGVNAWATWYGMKEQAKENQKAREAQERLFNQQMGWEKEQYSGNMNFSNKQLDTSTRLTNKQMAANQKESAANRALSERQSGMQYRLASTAQKDSRQLADRQMALNERQIANEQANNRFNNIAVLIANMTKMYSSPESRARFAQLYRRG